MKKRGLFGFVFIVTTFSVGLGQTLTGSLTIHLDQSGPAIDPNYYGLMTEEINHSYDGGLYAELIRDRSFRDPHKPSAWTVTGGQFSFEGGSDASLKVQGTGGQVEISNSGYWGIPVKPNETFTVTLRAKASPEAKGPIQISIVGNSGNDLGSTRISGLSSDWKLYKLKLKTGNVAASKDNRFVLRVPGNGTVRLNYVSLFPPTFHGRPNGFRSDLMDLLGQLKPSFLRMPGGNYLEGNKIPTRFDWKATLGNPMDRPGHEGPWGYWSSDGMGLLEFLEWCEDLRMRPLLAVYAGYSLEQDHIDPGPKLEPFVQDALDEIEYVTGDSSTKWGSVRAKNGHPKPFELTEVEIGNEDMFDRSRSYEGRFAQFADAIRSRYPQLKLIATMPVTSRKPDLVDDHYYRSSAEMARDSGHYDEYPRTDPKIFVGEWASTEGRPTPTLQAALGDAAWLTGLEHDADVVKKEAYAPLLVNVNPGAAQWGTNLIGYDALSSFGSPSYYVQSMFAQYTGKTEVPTEVSVALPPTPEVTPRGAVGLGTYQTDSEFKDMSVTHDGQTVPLDSPDSPLAGWTPVSGTWVADSAQGAIRQTSLEPMTLITKGDATWTDYIYTLKAKRLKGEEGFMIPFHVRDADDVWYWNVGGWGNTRTTIQAREAGAIREVGRATRMHLDTDRWYDIKIELKNRHIRCYLDGKLISEADEKPAAPVAPIYASTSRNGIDLFLKVTNVSDRDVDLSLDFEGHAISNAMSGLQLTGGRSAMNSVQNPKFVAPTAVRFTLLGKKKHRIFPARSVTVLKIRPSN